MVQPLPRCLGKMPALYKTAQVQDEPGRSDDIGRELIRRTPMQSCKKPKETIIFTQLIGDYDHIRRNRYGVPLPRTIGYRVLILFPGKSKPFVYARSMFERGFRRRTAIFLMKQAARYAAEWQRSHGAKVVERQLAPIKYFGVPPKRAANKISCHSSR